MVNDDLIEGNQKAVDKFNEINQMADELCELLDDMPRYEADVYRKMEELRGALGGFGH